MLSRTDNFRSKLKRVAATDFDLAKTLDSGQVFHWMQKGDGFVGTIGETAVYVEQGGKSLRFEGAPADLIARYFALDHPLREICASFPNDPTMVAAAEFCLGLRIIRQPKWECLATFITSSMKQVAHIRQMSEALRRRFGEEREIRGQHLFTFPSAERLAAASEEDLRGCGLGYRAPNLLKTARLVASKQIDLDQIGSRSSEELRAALCQLPGVGAKVANCVMLFAYEHLNAFPIDVWIARVLRERYFPRKRKLTEKVLREFAAHYFGSHGGYAQQYLFHHARKTQPYRRKGRNDRAGGARVAERANRPGPAHLSPGKA